MAIRKMREENGHPFKTYERGFPVGRLEVRRIKLSARQRLVLDAARAAMPACVGCGYCMRA